MIALHLKDLTEEQQKQVFQRLDNEGCKDDTLETMVKEGELFGVFIKVDLQNNLCYMRTYDVELFRLGVLLGADTCIEISFKKETTVPKGMDKIMEAMRMLQSEELPESTTETPTTFH